MTPDETWETFIAHLNKVQPLTRDGSTEHKLFFGSIASYKAVFLEALNEHQQPPIGDFQP
jgi:hypothetical protein